MFTKWQMLRQDKGIRVFWRCHDCGEQYTIRKGTVYEESRLDLRHWCSAFWRASTSKKGVAALEIQRHCQISYKSALFLMNRIRFAMAPELANAPKLTGTVECDETYVGGKPRYKGISKRGRGTNKTPVFAAVERNGNIRRKVITDVTARQLKSTIQEMVDTQASVSTISCIVDFSCLAVTSVITFNLMLPLALHSWTFRCLVGSSVTAY